MRFKLTHKNIRYFSLMLLMGVVSAMAGYRFGKAGFELKLQANPPKIDVVNKTPPDQTVDFSLFWEVWDLLNAEALQRPLPAQDLLYGAISGLTQALDDPYTVFLTPQQSEGVSQSLNGEYEGIGAELALRDQRLIVVAPLEGSPAMAAGVEPGDWIVKIEGDETVGISIADAVSKIKGQAGTVSHLTLAREEIGIFSVDIVREKITLKSVSWRNEGSGVAYIRLSRFGEHTASDWSQVVREIQEEVLGLRAVIIDVRSNPGGYLSGSIYVASEFISSGPVVLEDFGRGRSETFKVSRKGEFIGVPVVVLVDGGSASASEILAGALRDRLGSVLVGERTFGKGTVQMAKDLPDGAGVHITVARWLTPEQYNIHEAGLEPDITVERGEEGDTQLERALEVAKQL